ncbi:ADP-ribosylglycohydrolase family protein [Patulibacter minatonensis]|uniref:ADP-ribosylglycohydrolase family protein n=1 Tax=Patulibacter minatonensis TaxID=298163 RepID=UPI0006882710|nr:ADP-ribosylglycohydrolase family protein [Patulibacter minatonensis]
MPSTPVPPLPSPTRPDRCRGALLGLAVGDAIGTTVEFSMPGSFPPMTDMVGGGPFGLPAGAWTDDTSMALCLADSLLARRAHDPADVLARYVRWYRHGERSSTGTCFDIGIATRQALERFERTGDPRSGLAFPDAGGNGVLMRLAPLILAFGHSREAAVDATGRESDATHGHVGARDAARVFAALLADALDGGGRDGVLGPDAPFLPLAELDAEVAVVAGGSFRAGGDAGSGADGDGNASGRDAGDGGPGSAGSDRVEATGGDDQGARPSGVGAVPPGIAGRGFAPKSLEAALWAVWSTRSFADAVLAAVNLGDDADTTGAIAGQLAGALYGAEAIPDRWRRRVLLGDEIEGLADGLLALSAELSVAAGASPQDPGAGPAGSPPAGGSIPPDAGA